MGQSSYRQTFGVLMRAKASRRLILVVPALALCAALLSPDRTRSAETPRGSLAGQLLIATPAMRDTRFDHAVILILKHDKEGALGIVINRPLGERPMAHLLGDSSVTGNVQVFVGGPVEPNVGFIVHSADYHRAATLDVDGRVAMTANREVLRDIADKKGPAKVLIAFGYAGWAPGQLEAELAHNVWYTAPEDPALVFDDDRDKVWEHATARRTQDL
jgi:putative transcriptional regulator